MMIMARILFIEDAEYEINRLIKGLERRHYDVHVERWAIDAIEHLQQPQNQYDLIVLNLELLKGPGQEHSLPDEAKERGIYLLEFIRNELKLSTPIIILSGYLDDRQIKSAIKHLKKYYSKALKKGHVGYTRIISIIEEALSNGQPQKD